MLVIRAFLCLFQQFSTQRFWRNRNVENSGILHSSGENVLYSSGSWVKKEKKTTRLSFGKKKKLPDFSPEYAMENAGKYFMYKSKALQ